MSDITPEKVVDTLILPNAFSKYLDAWVRTHSEGNVVHIEVAPNLDGEEDAPRHFTAVVVEGEQTPIVLARPDVSFLGLDFEGGAFDDDADGWQVVAYSSTAKWPCPVKDADSVLFRGAPGHISFTEARRFAAALVAIADAAEAAQAETDGAR
ncbi:hypothetical protein ACIBHX_01620 [Nonomuraea sp. NPDC050536]|uniref:hypothetical protein n=1 Tax=Nonomuraea sp. NPDC050536 TaxID=3364366 RepID=UPI0037C977C7